MADDIATQLEGAVESLGRFRDSLEDNNIRMGNASSVEAKILKLEKKYNSNLFVKIRSTGKLIKAEVSLKENYVKVKLNEKELGISPGQACVFYSKDPVGDKVLGGGWIDSNYLFLPYLFFSI